MLEGMTFQPACRTGQYARLLKATQPAPFPVRRHARFARLVALCDREEIEDAVELLIGYLNAREDPDLDMDIADARHDAEEDFGIEEKGEPGSWPEGYQSTMHCVADDDFDGPTDRAAMNEHRDRIRRTRCDRVVHRAGGYGGGGWVDYKLPGAHDRAATGRASDLLS